MPRKLIGAITAIFLLATLVCALSALPAQTAAFAERLAQPSDRPPLSGTQTAVAATMTAAAQVPPLLPPEATREPPPTVATIVPFPTATRPRVTRTSTATQTATTTATATDTAVPASAFETATSQAATAQAATVQAIVALTSTALWLSLPTATSTLAPLSPTSVPPTAYPSLPQAYPAAATSALDAGPLLWLVVAVPFIALALALWWLFMRRFPLYPGWGRPRRGSQRVGRRYARRRSFPF